MPADLFIRAECRGRFPCQAPPRVLKHAVFCSAPECEAAMLRFIAGHHGREAKPVRRTADPATIIAARTSGFAPTDSHRRHLAANREERDGGNSRAESKPRNPIRARSLLQFSLVRIARGTLSGAGPAQTFVSLRSAARRRRGPITSFRQMYFLYRLRRLPTGVGSASAVSPFPAGNHQLPLHRGSQISFPVRVGRIRAAAAAVDFNGIRGSCAGARLPPSRILRAACWPCARR